jgi:hypothetical protein
MQKESGDEAAVKEADKPTSQDRQLWHTRGKIQRTNQANKAPSMHQRQLQNSWACMLLWQKQHTAASDSDPR